MLGFVFRVSQTERDIGFIWSFFHINVPKDSVFFMPKALTIAARKAQTKLGVPAARIRTSPLHSRIPE